MNESSSHPETPTPTPPSPEAPRRRSRALLLWALIALLVAGGAGFWYWKSRTGAPDDSAASSPAGGTATGGRRFGGRAQPVSAQAARRQDLRVTVAAIGTITALNTATVRSRVDGELRRILFTEGQQVKAGQLLAEIDPRAFEVALAQAQGQLARDAAQLRNAQIDPDRYNELLAKDSIAKQQVDTQEALVRQLKGTVQVDQAQVDAAKLQLSYTRITAPIAGRLGLRQVDLGNVVRAGDANGLVTINQTQPLAVVFAVPESHLPQINRKLKAGEALTVEAWDREQRNRLAQGRVATTDNAIDTPTGTIRLKAEFANADGSLFPNQFVNIRLQLDTLANALVVPSAALQRGSVGTFVYLIKEDGTVTLRRVTPGAVDGDWVNVQGELNPGDRLVTDGADRLREGAKVDVIAPGRAGRAGGGGGGGAGARADGAAAPASGPAPRQGADAKGALDTRTPPQGLARPASATGAAAPKGEPGPASAPAAAGAPAEGGERPRWMDRLPPELVEKLKAMPPEERRDFLQKLRERRQQRESGG